MVALVALNRFTRNRSLPSKMVSLRMPTGTVTVMDDTPAAKFSVVVFTAVKSVPLVAVSPAVA